MSDREEERREAVTAADDTGMLAGEETMARLHAELPDEHPAHATIDELHAALRSQPPDPHAIRKHVGVLRSLPELEAAIANWWDDPKTQRFVANLGQIGL